MWELLLLLFGTVAVVSSSTTKSKSSTGSRSTGTPIGQTPQIGKTGAALATGATTLGAATNFVGQQIYHVDLNSASTESHGLTGTGAFLSTNPAGKGAPMTSQDFSSGLAIYTQAKQRFYVMAVAYFQQENSHDQAVFADEIGGIEKAIQAIFSLIASDGASAPAVATQGLATAQSDASNLATGNVTPPVDPGQAPNYTVPTVSSGAFATTTGYKPAAANVASFGVEQPSGVTNSFVLGNWDTFLNYLMTTYGTAPTTITVSDSEARAVAAYGATQDLVTFYSGATSAVAPYSVTVPYWQTLMLQIRRAYAASQEATDDYVSFIRLMGQPYGSDNDYIVADTVQDGWRIAYPQNLTMGGMGYLAPGASNVPQRTLPPGPIWLRDSMEFLLAGSTSADFNTAINAAGSVAQFKADTAAIGWIWYLADFADDRSIPSKLLKALCAKYQTLFTSLDNETRAANQSWAGTNQAFAYVPIEGL